VKNPPIVRVENGKRQSRRQAVASVCQSDSGSDQPNRTMIEVQGAQIGHVDQLVAGPIDLSVRQSEIVAIVGPSGCGKTTLLKTISGEIPLLGGRLIVDGQTRPRPWLVTHLSRTLQSFPLLHWLTVSQNLILAAKIRGIDALNIDDVLEEFSALHLKTRYPRTLSGGERCRASLAQAVISRPKILLLDEPFTGLDLQVKEDIAEHLFSFARTHQTAIVFVTHDLYDACGYAQRVTILTARRPASVGAVVDPTDADALDQIRHAMRGGSH
jgi:ABC-type nitrate/sulfonate/bicarbonate transport system ATPase subunit